MPPWSCSSKCRIKSPSALPTLGAAWSSKPATPSEEVRTGFPNSNPKCWHPVVATQRASSLLASRKETVVSGSANCSSLRPTLSKRGLDRSRGREESPVCPSAVRPGRCRCTASFSVGIRCVESSANLDTTLFWKVSSYCLKVSIYYLIIHVLMITIRGTAKCYDRVACCTCGKDCRGSIAVHAIVP